MDSLVFRRDGTVLYPGGLHVINVWSVSNLSNGADLMYSLRDRLMTRVVSLLLSEDESEPFQFSHPSDIVFARRTQLRELSDLRRGWMQRRDSSASTNVEQSVESIESRPGRAIS